MKIQTTTANIFTSCHTHIMQSYGNKTLSLSPSSCSACSWWVPGGRSCWRWWWRCRRATGGIPSGGSRASCPPWGGGRSPGTGRCCTCISVVVRLVISALTGGGGRHSQNNISGKVKRDFLSIFFSSIKVDRIWQNLKRSEMQRNFFHFQFRTKMGGSWGWGAKPDPETSEHFFVWPSLFRKIVIKSPNFL